MKEHIITDDLQALYRLFRRLSPHRFKESGNQGDLLEIVMDLGRDASIRFRSGELRLDGLVVSQEDIDFVTERIGDFGDDNRGRYRTHPPPYLCHFAIARGRSSA